LLNSMVGLNANTYHNSYETMVRLQQLYEMEEIIDFKKFEKDAKSDLNKYFLSTSSIEETIQEKKNQLINIWNDR
jgi:DNA-binding transcriptional regulator YhcF (GntR family)